MKPPYRGAIFDLDGTLLDSLEDLAESTNVALAATGRATHPLAAYRYFVGDGLEYLMKRAAPDATPDDVKRLMAAMRAEYATRWDRASRPYGGVEDTLRELARRGVKMAILSNKPDDFTRQIAARFFADIPFAVVRGQLPGGPKKPDPAGALAILDAFGLAKDAVLYSGDTNTDMKTAQAAGLDAVGVLWGFRPESELREAGANALAREPADWLAWF